VLRTEGRTEGSKVSGYQGYTSKMVWELGVWEGPNMILTPVCPPCPCVLVIQYLTGGEGLLMQQLDFWHRKTDSLL
jgi:hypothetical protein